MAAKTALQRAVQAYTALTKGNGYDRVLSKVRCILTRRKASAGEYIISSHL